MNSVVYKNTQQRVIVHFLDIVCLIKYWSPSYVFRLQIVCTNKKQNKTKNNHQIILSIHIECSRFATLWFVLYFFFFQKILFLCSISFFKFSFEKNVSRHRAFAHTPTHQMQRRRKIGRGSATSTQPNRKRNRKEWRSEPVTVTGHLCFRSILTLSSFRFLVDCREWQCVCTVHSIASVAAVIAIAGWRCTGRLDHRYESRTNTLITMPPPISLCFFYYYYFGKLVCNFDPLSLNCSIFCPLFGEFLCSDIFFDIFFLIFVYLEKKIAFFIKWWSGWNTSTLLNSNDHLNFAKYFHFHKHMNFLRNKYWW